MIMLGGGFAIGNKAVQTLHCSCCGKNLGEQGWGNDKEFNDIEEKGWEFCPYCGETLFV